MKPLFHILLLLTFATGGQVAAQTKRSEQGLRAKTARSPEVGQTAVVIDETISVLRKTPSLFGEIIHRMQRGRKVQIQGVAEADGVRFYKVTAPPRNFGYVQADAVFGKFRPGDEDRLARLVHAIDGFEQLEMARQFFEMYPDSKLRPSLLLLFGDLIEEAAARLSRDASSRLRRLEMAASGAPMHSYYLSFNMLDRYRRLGIVFLFNPSTRQYHYDGASWREIESKFPQTNEAVEARKRLDSLKQKLERKAQ